MPNEDDLRAMIARATVVVPAEAPSPSRQRRQRKPRVRRLIEEAEKSGKTVTSVVATAEGYTLKLNEPQSPATTDNPWDQVLKDATH
jgi:hypothetical protein